MKEDPSPFKEGRLTKLKGGTILILRKVSRSTNRLFSFFHVLKMNYQHTHQMVIVGRKNGRLFVLFDIRDVSSHVLELFELCVSFMCRFLSESCHQRQLRLFFMSSSTIWILSLTRDWTLHLPLEGAKEV
ncbi:unnamed protein product [Citrullus colocynthis]|uniref:Uncharacterized protein n=1 Tax=Citrullus colocynthis TaxID=252529 RepID=A0ABP0YUJ2_9ROSI